MLLLPPPVPRLGDDNNEANFPHGKVNTFSNCKSETGTSCKFDILETRNRFFLYDSYDESFHVSRE